MNIYILWYLLFNTTRLLLFSSQWFYHILSFCKYIGVNQPTYFYKVIKCVEFSTIRRVVGPKCLKCLTSIFMTYKEGFKKVIFITFGGGGFNKEIFTTFWLAFIYKIHKKNLYLLGKTRIRICWICVWSISCCWINSVQWDFCFHSLFNHQHL